VAWLLCAGLCTCLLHAALPSGLAACMPFSGPHSASCLAFWHLGTAMGSAGRLLTLWLAALYRAKLKLALLSTEVASLSAGTTYAFKITVADFMGLTTTKAWAIRRLAEPVPMVSLPSSIAFSPSDGIKVKAAVLPESLCPGQPVAYSWHLEPALPGFDVSYSSRDLVIPSSLLIPADKDAYVATLTVGQGVTQSTAAVQLVRSLKALVPVVSGPSGDIFTGSSIELSAASSYDPEALPEEATSGMTYSWKCIREDGAPCFSEDSGITAPSTASWQLPASTLPGIDKTHTFIVTVSKGNSRISHAQTHITIRSRPVAEGVLVRSCLGACPALHSMAEPLTLQLQAAADVFIEHVVLKPMGSQLTTTKDARSITLPPSLLPSDIDVVTVEASIAQPGKFNAVTSLMVQLDRAPACLHTDTDGPCFTMDECSNQPFPNSHFTTAVNLYSSSAAVKCEAGWIDAVTGQRRTSYIGQFNTAVIRHLAPGEHVLYACGRNGHGETCAYKTVGVTFAADFDASQALLDQAKAGMPAEATATDITASSQLFAALLGLVQDSLGSTGQVTAELQKAVASFTEVLVTNAASKAVTADLDSIRQAAASTAIVMDAAPAELLSQASKDAAYSAATLGEYCLRCQCMCTRAW
jgi:hypothetical protein